MQKEMLLMSRKALDRSGVIRMVVEKRIKQKEAARRLGLKSTRQIRRLVKEYCRDGPKGLVSKHCGKPSNHRLTDETLAQTRALLAERYSDFGPTLAHEQLTEAHNLLMSVETVRKYQTEWGFWQPKSRKQQRAFQLRERRPCFGELVQIDGSPHDWFEGRASSCTLIVFIDDATSRLLYLRFVPTETTEAYMDGLRYCLGRYGRPGSFYSDRHSIFRVNTGDTDDLTQFGRVLKTFDIEAIHARTPQAKGRVERANQTLQDRLTKKMRLAGINSMKEGNAFLASYMEDYNRRFAKQPASNKDVHRQVLHNAQELDLILSLHSRRKMSKNLTLQYNNILYQVKTKTLGYAMRGAWVTVCEHFNGQMTILYKGRGLEYSTFKLGEKPPAIADEKTINRHVDQAIQDQQKRTPWKPAPDHPWKQYPQRQTVGAT